MTPWIDVDGHRVLPLNRRVGRTPAQDVWARGRGKWSRCAVRGHGPRAGYSSEIVMEVE